MTRRSRMGSIRYARSARQGAAAGRYGLPGRDGDGSHLEARPRRARHTSEQRRGEHDGDEQSEADPRRRLAVYRIDATEPVDRSPPRTNVRGNGARPSASVREDAATWMTAGPRQPMTDAYRPWDLQAPASAGSPPPQVVEPEQPGSDGAPRPPRLAEDGQLVGARTAGQGERFPDGGLQRQVADRPDIRPAEHHQQVDRRGPRTDARQGLERTLDLRVVLSGQPIQVQRCRRPRRSQGRGRSVPSGG